MRSLSEIKDVRNTLTRIIEREAPLRELTESPAEPGWILAYVARRGAIITVWVLHPHNLDRRKAMLEHDCQFGKAREGIDLSDGEWDSLVLAEQQEVEARS